MAEADPGSGAPLTARLDRRGALLLVGLLVLSLVAFGFTRALRSQDDVVNSVSVSPAPGGAALIEFTTVEQDDRVDVLVISDGGEQVRALQLGEPLPAGRQRFLWDGAGDDGSPAPAGRYRLRVILGEAGRDVEPGPVEFEPGGREPGPSPPEGDG